MIMIKITLIFVLMLVANDIVWDIKKAIDLRPDTYTPWCTWSRLNALKKLYTIMAFVSLLICWIFVIVCIAGIIAIFAYGQYITTLWEKGKYNA